MSRSSSMGGASARTDRRDGAVNGASPTSVEARVALPSDAPIEAPIEAPSGTSSEAQGDPTSEARAALEALLRERRTLVLSGAGVSTDSGIPDYRGPTSRPRAPMRFQAFVRDAEARRRYWARSAVGWPITAGARPNGAHRALARLERRGVTSGVITQNVDGLHQRSGSRRVLELHGSLSSVICLDCGTRSARSALQERIRVANPDFDARSDDVAPDGDVEIAEAWTRRFVVPPCLACGGVLKPDVVFFGENVPRERIDRARSMVEAAEALLVVGSSLTVFSGYRFVRWARELGIPVAIANDGPTRGDPDATVRVHARLGRLLPELAARSRPLPAI